MLFSAEITDFRIVHNVLKSIAVKDYVIVRPMEEGLKLTLDEMKCIETSIYIPSSIFTSYNVDSTEDIIFKMSLKVFVDILNIFGDEGNPTFKLSYATVGAPLCIVMNEVEENITVDCEIRTMNVDDFTDVSLADECNLNKMVIGANILAELLNRLNNSADDLKVTLSPDPPYFTLSTTGIAGESEVNVSKNSEAVTLFQCQKTTTATYSFSNIRYILKVMGYADKVAISTGESGLLGLQLVIVSDDRQLYVEYYVTSQYLTD
ncbi:cell cycle checkpoint protein RAD1-like [Diabrotica virgifera virgifera]|uniref:Cell cycle checkpoint protein RAD1-like n=1 Tax=Diabrotica virgifera virgifera TaxID=50390 RepID=A0A6P7HJ57_DIAVI|nr:cell cycle checkpoint protein RAD1-like [Diabrotica virgifera virgifera]